MSKLDNLYTQFRFYAREIHKNPRMLHAYVILYEDGSGKVEAKHDISTNDHPFNIVTEELLRFDSPGDGARKIEGILNGKKEFPPSE